MALTLRLPPMKFWRYYNRIFFVAVIVEFLQTFIARGALSYASC